MKRQFLLEGAALGGAASYSTARGSFTQIAVS
jgi:hypothetical protein